MAKTTAQLTATIDRLERLLDSGVSGQTMIDGNMVNIEPAAIRTRLRELYIQRDGIDGFSTGVLGLDLRGIR